MFKKVRIIVNPVAGKGKAVEYSEHLAALLKKEYGAQVEIKETQGEADATKWAKEAADQDYDTVLCLGGDGTVSETVNGLVQANKRPAFGFIPMGTVNDLGRALGYEMNPDKAIESFKNMTVDKLDVGKINDQIFINVVALGPIAEEVMNTDSTDKNSLGVLAYIRDGVKALFNDKGYQITITVDDQESVQITTNLLLIALTNSVGGVDLMTPEANYDDGLAYLVATKGHTTLDLIRAGLAVGFSNIAPENLLKMTGTQFVIKTMDESVPQTNVDGDTGPALPITVEVLKHAIDILVPEK